LRSDGEALHAPVPSRRRAGGAERIPRRERPAVARGWPTPGVHPAPLAAVSALGRFAPRAAGLPDPRTARAVRAHLDAMARCQAAFDLTPGVLAARGAGAGPAIDRLTRAARERAVDLAVAALNDAEASRRLLAAPQPGSPGAGRTAEQERSAKAAMMARFRLTARQRARAVDGRGVGPALTLRVRPAQLTAAGRAALQVLLREAGVDAGR
jgi:hypothetical protein